MLGAVDRWVLSHNAVAALLIVVVNLLQLVFSVFPEDFVTGASAACGAVLAFGSSAHAAVVSRMQERRPAAT